MPDDKMNQEALDKAEKKVADAIEEAIGTPVSAEEEAMLEAAEVIEAEFPDD